VEWADLRGHAFDEPFFKRTLAAWREAEPAPTVRTGLDALEALDGEPSLDPDLIIAQASRCGSSLLSTLVSAGGATVLVSEPNLLPQLMTHHLGVGFDRPVEGLLRQAIRAQGRIRFGTERRYVLKLNSQMVRHLPDVRRAFPDAPVVWLQRRPAEIVCSHMRTADGRAASAAAARAALHRTTLAFLGATAFVDDDVLVLDYRDLPQAAWTRVGALMGLKPRACDIARMRALAERDAKSGDPFTPRAPEALPEALAAVVRENLDPLYETLAARGPR
jgi:hypothetical protein